MDLRALLESINARQFLRKALELHYFRKGKVNISEFSKKAGFSSRSFISEYLSGKKNLSRESLARLKGALKLPRAYSQFFTLLVFQEQPDIATISTERISVELKTVKENILNNYATIANFKSPQKILGKRVLYRIFAGLGSESEGADLSEILKRTGLSLERVRGGLNTLIENNLVIYRNQKYYPMSSQLDFLHFKSPELTVLTKEICSEISIEAEHIVDSKNDFVFYTAFTLQSHQVPVFKEKLREAIYSVLDQYQNDNGDTVQQLFICSKK